MGRGTREDEEVMGEDRGRWQCNKLLRHAHLGRRLLRGANQALVGLYLLLLTLQAPCQLLRLLSSSRVAVAILGVLLRFSPGTLLTLLTD